MTSSYSLPAQVVSALQTREQELQEICELEEIRETGPEEIPRIRQKLHKILQTFHNILSTLQDSGADEELARHYIKMAIASYKLGYYERDAQTVRKALDMNRKGLTALDSNKHTQDCIDGYVNLADCLKELAFSSTGDEMETYWNQAYSALKAAEFLVRKQQDPLLHALVRKSMVGVLEECYYGDRDENLCDAIRFAELALLGFRDQKKHPGAAPVLLNYIGNCYMKRKIDRSRSIRLGHDAYEMGLKAFDGESFPRLRQTLTNNLSWAKTVLKQGQEELPEKEMVRRFSVKIKEHVDNRDLSKAENMAWGFMRWGWSLPVKPNVHVAYAHNTLGKIYSGLKYTEMAASHFYSAQVVLWGTVHPGHSYFKGIEEMKNMFATCLVELGQSDSLKTLQERAGFALEQATASRNHGIQIVEKEPHKALQEFETALKFYPYDPVSLFYRGNLRWQQQNYYGAIKDYDLSILLLPKNTAALVNRGNLKLFLNDVRGAYEDFDEVLKEQPEQTGALWGRATTLVFQKEWEKAIKDLSEYVKHIPQDGSAYVLRGRCFKEQNKLQDAIMDLRHGLSLSTSQDERDILNKEIKDLAQGIAKDNKAV